MAIHELIADMIDRSDYLDILAKPILSQTTQISLFGEERIVKPKRTRVQETPALAVGTDVSQQMIDEILCDGSNERYSTLRICAYMKRDEPSKEAASFLQAEYGTGGKGFIIDDVRISEWFDENGIRIAVGESAIEAKSVVTIPWVQAARRIRELLELGRFLPQSELNRVDGNERKEIAEKLVYLDRDCEKKENIIVLPEGFNGFPEQTAFVAGMLNDEAQLKGVRGRLADFIDRYEQIRELLHFHYHRPHELLSRIDGLLNERLRKKEERKDKLHQNYLKRKANGQYQSYTEKTKEYRKEQRNAKKEAIRAEDMEKGVFCTVDMLPKLEPKIIKK